MGTSGPSPAPSTAQVFEDGALGCEVWKEEAGCLESWIRRRRRLGGARFLDLESEGGGG